MKAAGQMQPRFEGFSGKTLSFLKNLSANNNREWFDSHRGDYEEHFVAPARAFVESMGPELVKVRPEIEYHPDHNGKGSVKKIFTDRRFNPDRDPYKAWLDIMFWEGPLKSKKCNSCLSLRIEAKRLTYFAGLKQMESPTLKKYRNSVSKNGDALAKAVKMVSRYPGYKINDPHYANVPRGFDADHPHAGLLRHNALFVYCSMSIPEELHTSKFVDFSLKQFRQMEPLQGWLAKMLSS